MENTAHASRSYNSPLSVDFSNVLLEAGKGINLKDGIIITDLMGLHAGANPISGEFSVQAFGLKVEGGESVHAVENFAVAGEWLELLQNIVGIGEKLEWLGSKASPMVEVAELSFAGA